MISPQASFLCAEVELYSDINAKTQGLYRAKMDGDLDLEMVRAIPPKIHRFGRWEILRLFDNW